MILSNRGYSLNWLVLQSEKLFYVRVWCIEFNYWFIGEGVGGYTDIVKKFKFILEQRINLKIIVEDRNYIDY